MKAGSYGDRPASDQTGMRFALKEWSLTSLKKKLIKIGTELASHRRYSADCRPC